mgnify:CR=1 FL=1
MTGNGKLSNTTQMALRMLPPFVIGQCEKTFKMGECDSLEFFTEHGFLKFQAGKCSIDVQIIFETGNDCVAVRMIAEHFPHVVDPFRAFFGRAIGDLRSLGQQCIARIFGFILGICHQVGSAA